MKYTESRMSWERLLSSKRFGLERYHEERRHSRSDFQRDYDRLVFSAPFRRLQNKTQVFPLPGSVFVHNRLTHSLEVSCVGRSLGNNVSSVLFEKYANEPWAGKLHGIGAIVAAACLAHDMGNPPFGHSGERAIATYFSEGNGLSLKNKLGTDEWKDLTHFEGNANAFRLLTHQFNGRRAGGFVMTYSTLASIVKYPYASNLAGKRGKFGFFTSEADDFVKVADTLGMRVWTFPEYDTPTPARLLSRSSRRYLLSGNGYRRCTQAQNINDRENKRTVSRVLFGFSFETHSGNVEYSIGHQRANRLFTLLRSRSIGR